MLFRLHAVRLCILCHCRRSRAMKILVSRPRLDFVSSCLIACVGSMDGRSEWKFNRKINSRLRFQIKSIRMCLPFFNDRRNRYETMSNSASFPAISGPSSAFHPFRAGFAELLNLATGNSAFLCLAQWPFERSTWRALAWMRNKNQERLLHAASNFRGNVRKEISD